MQIKDKKLILKKSLYYLFGFLPLIITLFIYPHIPKHVPSHKSYFSSLRLYYKSNLI